MYKVFNLCYYIIMKILERVKIIKLIIKEEISVKFQKSTAIGLCAVLLAAGLSGCNKSTEQTGEQEGKINISIGNWPDETQPEAQAVREDQLEQMKEKYPDINVIPDTYKYDTKTFTMKASANQLPTQYNTWFTEINKIIDAGYAADITDVMEQHGMTEALNPELLALMTDENGRIYGFPTDAYAQGLTINKAIFREAGLVNEDGSIMIPDTYDEVAEFSQTIREKTGKAGFVLPTTNNCGGWHFLNIAWSYGVDFMEQREDGTWEATFNTPEAVAALQYVKDLKWKYNAFPDNTVIDQTEAEKIFATGQAAMLISAPSSNYSQKYGMNIDDIMIVRMPAGPAGRFAQMGGNLVMFSPTATPEQLDACFKWLELTGYSVTLDEQGIANKEKNYQATLDQGGIVLDRSAFQIWVDPERVEQETEIASKYTNVNPADYESYYAFEDVTLKPEEPVACQQLYAVLDGCIQEVITNENADCAALIETACHDFQVNHLDKEE